MENTKNNDYQKLHRVNKRIDYAYYKTKIYA